MSQRSFLNLTHNPFVPPREGFFTGGDRKTHLDHLRHLSQWSRRILLVTGPFGIGKSTLYRELSNTLEPKAKAARLSGTVATSERDVLVSLVQGFGIASSPEATSDEMASLVLTHVREQEDEGRVCLAMIDEGHLLDPTAIQRLVELVSEAPLRIVMFAESAVVATITRACRNFELEWFEIRLTGLPGHEVRDYLEWRFRQAQYRGLLPFTDEQVERIAARSGGNPGTIDNLASDLLSRLETGELSKQKPGFPVMHVVLAVLVACIAGFAYLLVQDEQAGPETAVTALPVPKERIDEPVSEPPAPAPVEARRAPPEPAVVAAEQPVAEAAPEEAADVTGEREPQPGEEAPVAIAAEGLQPEPRAEAPAETSPPAAQERPEAVASVEPAAPVEPTVSEPAPPPEPVPPKVVARVPTSGIKGDSWILRQDPQTYTLQLVTVSNRDRAEALVNRQADAEEFAIYTMSRSDRELYVVIYGVFSSLAAAERAAGGLSGELAQFEPWVRPMRLVQDAVRG